MQVSISVLAIFALVLIIEGLLPFIAPRTYRAFMLIMLTKNDSQIRSIGLFNIAIGLILLWIF